MKKLLDPAHRVLEMNWRDGFTVPTSGLYPFQWNWDSGFIALGHYYANPTWSMRELDSLFSGQWKNGLLPHIIFHSEQETTYFPNYDFWESNVNRGAPQFPKSSGITQPAVHGFVLESLLNKNPQDEVLKGFARQLFPQIVNYHRFLYQYRDPHQEGLMYIYHPWESGRDNSPLWDESLSRITIREGDLPKYERRDTNIADPAERPTSEQYDRYVYLLLLGKRHRYDGREIAEESPFLIQDDMMNAILIKSNESLIRIGRHLHLDTGEIEEWQAQSRAAFEAKFWNDKLQMYTSFDLRAGKQIEMKEIGGIIPIFAEIPTREKAALLSGYLWELNRKGYYLCPSFDVENNAFDSCRYWRGPIWPHMNWMVYRGLQAYGLNDTAALVKADTLEMVERFGFFEYYEPQRTLANSLNKAYGGANFSWTASSIIDLIHNP